MTQPDLVRVASLADVRRTGRSVVSAGGHTIVLFALGDGSVRAVDNRCPHMGFPLDRGTVRDGILTCHWHHARFDLCTGGTFDLFADDVRAFPVEVRDGQVWLDLSPHGDPRQHQRARLEDGLKHNIRLVVAKAVIALMDGDSDARVPYQIALDFGVRYRSAGWGQGQTIHAAMMNLLPYLDAEDRPRALYQGVTAVARDADGQPPRFQLDPLPGATADVAQLKTWFRQFVEVRDGEGAERCLVSAIRAGADTRQVADLLFAAATDHRYLQIGHVVDFTNKALEALNWAGWEFAEPVLASLMPSYVNADRMEESNAWRHPVDLVAILDTAFAELPAVLEAGRTRRSSWQGREFLVPVLLADDPQAIADGLLTALRDGATEDALAATVAYAAALRIARFHTSNEFGDWDTVLHTFTFASAVHQAIRRAPSAELLRGVFDAAMSVYLDRFLNTPAAPLPESAGEIADPDELPGDLLSLLDRQQQVNEAGTLVARYLYGGGDPDRLLATIGKALLREDPNFHTIQTVEGCFRQYADLRGTPAGVNVLVAAARYLAAHAPTSRAMGQTYQIARRLHRGEKVYEG
jgi:nitrite reductase/ring-hydroxylating ferredoxin subunit